MLRQKQRHRWSYAWEPDEHTWLRRCLCWLVLASLLTSTAAIAMEPAQTFMLGNTAVRVPAHWLSVGMIAYESDENYVEPTKPSSIALRPRWISIGFSIRTLDIAKPLDSSILPRRIWLFPPQEAGGKAGGTTIEEARTAASEARQMVPDSDGFVLLPARLPDYRPHWVLVGSEADHPSGAPFMIQCRDWDPAADMSSYCRSSFLWSDDVGLMFDFDLRLFPKRRWSEMHRGLTQLLTYLTKTQ